MQVKFIADENDPNFDDQVNYRGYDNPRGILEKNKIYELDNILVHSGYSEVFLTDFPDKSFNSVQFEGYGFDMYERIKFLWAGQDEYGMGEIGDKKIMYNMFSLVKSIKERKMPVQVTTKMNPPEHPVYVLFDKNVDGDVAEHKKRVVYDTLNAIQDNIRYFDSKLLGELYTLLEIAITDNKQREALKTQIKNATFRWQFESFKVIEENFKCMSEGILEQKSIAHD